MKPLLAAACIISIAIGFIIGKSTSSPEQASEETPTKPTRHDRSNTRDHRDRSTGDTALLDSILNGRPISEIPPADLSALIAKLTKYDPNLDALSSSKQAYQLQLLLSKLSASDLVNLANAISSDPEAQKNSALNTIAFALADKDPDRALDWLSTQEKNKGLYSIVLSVIAKSDPAAAAELLQNSIFDGTLSFHEHWSATYSIGQHMAKLGSTSLLNFMDSLPQRQQGSIFHSAIQHLPTSEYSKLLTEVYQRKLNGEYNHISMEMLFSKALSEDEAKAREWFSKLPDDDKKNAIRLGTASALFQVGDKEAAASWMRDALANSPGNEKQVLESVIMNLAYNNPEGVPFFTKLLPEGIEYKAQDLEQYAMNSLFNGPGGLTSIASAIRNPAEQAHLIANTLKKISSNQNSFGSQMNATDYKILSHQISTMGFTGENAELVNTALEAARNPTPAKN